MSLDDFEQRFASFSALESAIDNYSKKNFVHLYKRDARKLESAGTRSKAARKANKDLHYYSIKYACVHGGRDFIQKKGVKGERETMTNKSDCPFNLLFILSKDGRYLQLSKNNSVHNHPIGELLYKRYHRARRLSRKREKKAGELMHMQINKKLLKDQLQKETGKIVLLKDLSNIAARYKAPSESLQNSIDKLRNNHGCLVDVIHKGNTLHGIFFQDEQMRHSFSAFPEILFIDGTYKLLNIRFVCYLFLIEDGNGNSEVVGVGLVASEDAPTIEWLVEAFQKNLDWKKTRVIMTDKDLVERKILKEKFRHVHLLLCKFHVLKAFKREVTTKKMEIKSEEADLSKKFLTKMCYAHSEEEYFSLYSEFLVKAPKSVSDYFNKNWHNIYEEWTHMASLRGSFLNFTNNRVESLNSKLKSVIKKYSSLASFIDHFFVTLSTLRSERDNNIANAILKIPTRMKRNEIAIYGYNNLLMPYPLEFIKKEFNAIPSIKLQEGEPGNFSYSSRNALHYVNTCSCTCLSYNSMKIPCRHILAVRARMGFELYDEDLVAPRWTKHYMKENQRIFLNQGQHSLNQGPANNIPNVRVTENRKTKPKSRQEKFRMASVVASQVADVISEASGNKFYEKMQLMENILNMLKANENVSICTGTCSTNLGLVTANVSENGENISGPNFNHDHDYIDYAENNGNVRRLKMSANFVGVRSDVETEKFNLPSTSMGNDHEFNDKSSDTVSNYEDQLYIETNEDFVDHKFNDNSSDTVSISEDQLCIEMNEDFVDVFDSNQNINFQTTSTNSPSTSTEASHSSQNTNFQTTSMNPTSTSTDANGYEKILLPQCLKRRGNSKGFDKTVIGLRKRKIPTKKKNSPVAFHKLKPEEQQSRMLQWFVSENLMLKAIEGKLIEEDEVETMPEKVPSGSLDKSINITQIKKYFTDDGWSVLEMTLAVKKERNVWLCRICQKRCLSDCIRCDGCLEWLHFECTKQAISIKRKDPFFCKFCKKAN